MTELKACPFCGKVAIMKTELQNYAKNNLYKVYCLYCHVSQTWKNDSNAAIDQWNKRVANE